MQTYSKKITGDGSAHTLASAIGNANIQCKWGQLAVGTGNASPVLVGGADVATQGFPLTSPNSGIALEAVAEISNFYHLDRCWYFAASGDVFWFLYGAD